MRDFEKDLVIDEMRPPNRGGQHVGSYNWPIRATHTPTGTTAIVGRHRSQHKNLEACKQMIEWELSQT